MMMSVFTRYKYVFAAAITLGQCAVLYYMIESRAQILRYGSEVTLVTEPVDPRDLLRGDYVTLGYPISRLDPVTIQGRRPDVVRSELVYVALAKGDGDIWMLSRASWQPFKDVGPAEVVLTGNTPDYALLADNLVPLSFGIERYYVPEGEGKAIEQGQANRAVLVTLAVAKNGQAQIKSLSMDGKILYAEPLY
jgi:uncharacterized membrane-anchored protein